MAVCMAARRCKHIGGMVMFQGDDGGRGELGYGVSTNNLGRRWTDREEGRSYGG